MEAVEKLCTASDQLIAKARKNVGDFFENGYDDDDAEEYVKQQLAALWEKWFKAYMDKQYIAGYKAAYVACLKAVNVSADSSLYTKEIEYLPMSPPVCPPLRLNAAAKKLLETCLTRYMTMLPRKI